MFLSDLNKIDLLIMEFHLLNSVFTAQ